jgi:hypothetical protein
MFIQINNIKINKLLLPVFLFFYLPLRADEGMWIPSLLKKLNESAMQTRGLKLTAEEIYSVNKSSLKDAVVNFGGGCTAEVVSYDGLLFTNHHCGYSQIQSHSSIENDYLKNGFWAMSRSAELPNPGLTATFVISIEDVTSKVISQDAKQMLVNIETLKREAVKGTHYKAEIKPFNYGNSYFLIITETFKDVRLVGAPPGSIGKFGGDTDNWMWPRHTGDFCIFRIYADKDNKPAEYSPDNVPYKPRYSFPISLLGVNENDFTMVFGFPGRTQQFLTSNAVEFIVNHANPAKIKMREAALNIIDADMRSSDKIRIQYSAKQARISNAYKKWIGETQGLKQFNAIDKKRELEKEYTQLALQNDAHTQYANLLSQIKDLYQNNTDLLLAYEYLSEFIFSGPECVRFSGKFETFATNQKEYAKNKSEKEELDKLLKTINAFYKDYNTDTDKKLFYTLFEICYKNIKQTHIPEYFVTINKKYKGNFMAYANELYSKSIFTDEKKIRKAIQSGGATFASKITRDPVYILNNEINKHIINNISEPYRNFTKTNETLMQKYVEGLMKIIPDKTYWYDANSTLRLSYGKAEGSSPRDGIIYTYYTTLSGMLEKYIPGDEEFDLPQKLIELEKNKDYGIYGVNNEMRVCFTGSNQTTGGNSGSPALDAYGYLIGINFDRTWESTMSDIMYNPARCRNIMVDIRYVLFIIDKFAGAGYLLNEMEIITPEKHKEKQKEIIKKRILRATEMAHENPDKEWPILNRALFYIEYEMWDDAKTDALMLQKINAKNTTAYYILGKVEQGYNRYADAIKEFDKVDINNPHYAQSLFAKATCLAELKKYDEAIKTFTRYIAINSKDAKGFYNRGMCYHLSGKSIEGCADLMVAEKLSGESENWLRKKLCD